MSAVNDSRFPALATFRAALTSSASPDPRCLAKMLLNPSLDSLLLDLASLVGHNGILFPMAAVMSMSGGLCLREIVVRGSIEVDELLLLLAGLAVSKSAIFRDCGCVSEPLKRWSRKVASGIYGYKRRGCLYRVARSRGDGFTQTRE